jgi:hypothetical protein
MAFNFGAFVGGMSRQVSENVESAKQFEREKQFRLDMLAEEEATKMRLARASERRAQRKQDQQNAALLKSMGYSDAKASWIMKGGTAAVSMYTDYAQKAQARGIDVNTMLDSSLFTSDQQDPRNEAAVAATLGFERDYKTAEPFEVDQTVMTSVLGEVKEPEKPKEYTSLEAGYAGTFSLIQIAKAEGDKEEVARLEGVLNEWEQQIIAEAKRNEDEPEPTQLFNDDSRGRIYKDALSESFQAYDFTTDMQGNITSKIAGREGIKHVARIEAAANLIDTATIKDEQGNIVATDQRLIQQAETLRKNAERSLYSYARNIVATKGGDDTQKTYGYFKSEYADGSITPFTMAKALRDGDNGRYKIGDVIVVNKDVNGEVVPTIMVYTGIPSGQVYKFTDGVEVQSMFFEAGKYSRSMIIEPSQL